MDFNAYKAEIAVWQTTTWQLFVTVAGVEPMSSDIFEQTGADDLAIE